MDSLLAQATTSDRNLVVALYVLHLAQGATILCMSIKSDTIDRCLHAAAKLSTAAHLMDPRLDKYEKNPIT